MEIADENHVAMGRYCGEELSRRDINVGGNEVVIKFHSDFYLGKKGFLLVFTPVQPCKFKRNFLTPLATLCFVTYEEKMTKVVVKGLKIYCT